MIADAYESLQKRYNNRYDRAENRVGRDMFDGMYQQWTVVVIDKV